ncbi:MAG: toll/interleukin-1 receptor domain-containing protein [Cyanobacteria bacterium P01_A01_bin.40]
MKIYISWSGERSKSVARILRELISVALQNVDIFLSTNDINSGASWVEIHSQWLTEADVGILCLTSDNINNPWISFEAGALYSSGKTLIPFLLDLSSADLDLPLAALQTVSFSKFGIKSILQELNRRLDNPQKPEYISRVVDKLWSDFLKEIKSIPPPSKETNLEKDTLGTGLKSERDLLYELLERVKNLELKTLKSE